MTDWVTISSLATAGGTLVLAVATFSSTRSANRTARIAERSLLEGVRPMLIPSREEDPTQRVRFGDDVQLEVHGHGGDVRRENNAIYLAIGLRNGGAGVARLQGWRARPQGPDIGISRHTMLGQAEEVTVPLDERPPLREFRRQQLDLMVPAGETGFWQGAVREPSEAGHGELWEAVGAGRPLWVDLLYGDLNGGQRAIMRLGLFASPDTGTHRASTLRYWTVPDDEAA